MILNQPGSIDDADDIEMPSFLKKDRPSEATEKETSNSEGVKETVGPASLKRRIAHNPAIEVCVNVFATLTSLK